MINELETSQRKNDSTIKENSEQSGSSKKPSESESGKNSNTSSKQAKENQSLGRKNDDTLGGFKLNPEESDKDSPEAKSDYSNNLPKIIEKLENAYKNLTGDPRSTTFQKILDNQDIVNILLGLGRKNLEDIMVYILNDFTIMIPGLGEGAERDKEKYYEKLYFLAIKKGQIRVLQALDKLELDYCKMKDEEGNTGLILAVIFSNIQIAKFFLKNSPDMLEIKNDHGYSPLGLAVYNNDNLMFFLLANNLESSITDGNSLLELAIRNENIDIINYLYPSKDKIKCNYKPSPLLLHFAVCQSNLEIFKIIANLTKKYDYQIESSKETPLHWAAMKGNYYIVKELLKLYKDNLIEIDQKNSYGVTPFMLANLRQDKSICQLFFDNGVDVNEQDNEGNSIVHLIAALGDVKWLKYMIKKFNVNCYLKNNKGDTPFIHAILNENFHTVEFFIELFKNSNQLVSTNINWRNKFGQTPLHAAVFTGNNRIIEILLKNKADINIYDANDLTPYHYAYIDQKKDVIKTIHNTLGVDKYDSIKYK